MRICKHQDCPHKHDSHGYCANHARQFRRWGRIRTKEELSAERSERNKRVKPNLGKKWSDEAKKAQSIRFKGRRLNTGRTHFKKGVSSWNRNTKGLMGAWNIGRKMSEEHKNILRLANLGRRPWNKIGDGITAATKLERDRFRKTVVDLVFQRDNYTCQFCDQYSGHLHVDHIQSWAGYPELRFKLDNCRTLCRSCHYYITFKRKMPEGSKWGLTTMTRERG